jgi:hypothetical protein
LPSIYYSVQVTVLVFLMPKKESTEEFFVRSYSKGSSIKLEIINRKKVKKDLQPETKKNYTCALVR